MEKEVSVQITSDEAFAKTRLSGCEGMQARKARHQKGRKEAVGTTKGDPKELAKSSPKEREISKFMGRQKQRVLPKNERTQKTRTTENRNVKSLVMEQDQRWSQKC